MRFFGGPSIFFFIFFVELGLISFLVSLLLGLRVSHSSAPQLFVSLSQHVILVSLLLGPVVSCSSAPHLCVFLSQHAILILSLIAVGTLL